MKSTDIRIGFGYDAHRFGENIPFVLGGVVIPFHKGCVAHSDGDVLIHAIMDALLGAAGLRDIGYYFPDSSDEYRGTDSKLLLQKVFEITEREGFDIINIDASILLEAPKISDFIPKMKDVLGSILHLDPSCIGIKASTNEGMGFVGSGEGIAASAVVLLRRKH